MFGRQAQLSLPLPPKVWCRWDEEVRSGKLLPDFFAQVDVSRLKEGEEVVGIVCLACEVGTLVFQASVPVHAARRNEASMKQRTRQVGEEYFFRCKQCGAEFSGEYHW